MKSLAIHRAPAVSFSLKIFTEVVKGFHTFRRVLPTLYCLELKRIGISGEPQIVQPPNAVGNSLSPKESAMSYFPGMQKGNLDSVKADEHGKIKKETVGLQGVSVTRVTFGVGAKWSNDLKEYAGTNSCQLPHVALVLSGTLRVVMDDGSQQDFSKNDVMLLPPGHDAWSVGNEPCVFVEFSRGNDYYEGDHSH